jgi:hypothetical protein
MNEYKGDLSYVMFARGMKFSSQTLTLNFVKLLTFLGQETIALVDKYKRDPYNPESDKLIAKMSKLRNAINHLLEFFLYVRRYPPQKKMYGYEFFIGEGFNAATCAAGFLDYLNTLGAKGKAYQILTGLEEKMAEIIKNTWRVK